MPGVGQDDADAGSITNTATVNADPVNPELDSLTGTSSATATASRYAAITAVKTASPLSGLTAGDTVAYHLVVTNTGDVTLNDVVVSDTMTGLTNISCDRGVEGSIGTLEPTEAVTCNADYMVTQDDVNDGGVSNTAQGAGSPANGDPRRESPSQVPSGCSQIFCERPSG